MMSMKFLFIRRWARLIKDRKISIKNGVLQVGDRPIIPFIEGDGTGPDIWKAYGAGQSFAVPADSVFEIACDDAYHYVCHFG